MLHFQIIEAANYAYTLKAVCIKSNGNIISNYQATFKDKIFDSSENSVVGTQHFSPVERKWYTQLWFQKAICAYLDSAPCPNSTPVLARNVFFLHHCNYHTILKLYNFSPKNEGCNFKVK